MQLVKVAITAAVSFLFLFLLTRMMGKRQVSQMSMFDYVVGITVGSIAAELATELEEPAKPLVAMAVYALLAVCFSVLSDKFLKFRRVSEGLPVVLFNNGCFYRENLKKSKIDLDEFLMQCRTAGYFGVQNLQTALLEPNGKISFLPLAQQRPVTPQDLTLSVQEAGMEETVVSDGNILQDGLKKVGKDEQWLKTKLKEQEKKVSDVFLATADNSGSFHAFSIR
ncbi:MAG TPA: DUF421 domain-containing protein [Ruminococcaceae bacterium]|nr:DUF421 domain-containing protein [Oscillospiraceae bacterium]